MNLRFGIFDHMERRHGVPLDQLYGERFELLARADELGFAGYHLAEHHHSALCMAPSQNLFLAAASRETRRIKLGSLVYLLPFHHPIRLIEEICMLDHLTGGRLMVGVGRGITAIEHTYWGWPPEEAQARYNETLEIMIAGLTSDTLEYHGRFYSFKNVPLELEPKQKPYPELWYAGTPESAAPLAMNFICHAGPRLPATVARYKELLAHSQALSGRHDTRGRQPTIGTSRHIFVAESDREADAVARAAWPVFQGNFAKRGMHGPGPETRPDGSIVPVPNGGPATELALDFDRAKKIELVITGSPETIRKSIANYPAELDYYMAAFQWGSLTHEQAMRSLELFGREVMPYFAQGSPACESPGKSTGK
jgi:alkanesulfonate monooxygenase SsuD/methylene tetrahydromethanopterin reductase-like flavin-dependent oxidoreductase (luciferase family)